MKIQRLASFACSLLLATGLFTSVAQAETLLFHTAYIAPPNNPANVWSDESGRHWNYIPTWTVWPTSSRSFYNTEGAVSPVQWKTTERLAYFHTDGQPTSALGYPDLVAQYGLYLSLSPISGVVYSTAEITLSNLNAEESYNLTFYGSRRIGVSKDASLAFAINGEAAGELKLHIGTHETELFVQNVKANANGEVIISISLPGGYDYGFLNAVKVESIPEPGTVGLIGMGLFFPFLFFRYLS